MRSDVLIVARPDRLPRIECHGGIAARHTFPDTVHLVSAAATPLGGDTITVRVIVEPGAQLTLSSVAATVALPGVHTLTSNSYFDFDVSGRFVFDPAPTVVAANAQHLSAVTVQLSDAGQIRLRERVQIGRANERFGFWSGALQAYVGGRSLLRHRVEMGCGSLASDALGAPQAYTSELCYPVGDIEPPKDTSATVLELAAGGTLRTWQGNRLSG